MLPAQFEEEEFVFIFLFVTVLNSGADLVIFISVQHFGYIIIINLANLKFVQTVTQEF